MAALRETFIITIADSGVSAGATSIPVDPLPGPVLSGTELYFGTGYSEFVNGDHAQGATSLAISRGGGLLLPLPGNATAQYLAYRKEATFSFAASDPAKATILPSRTSEGDNISVEFSQPAPNLREILGVSAGTIDLTGTWSGSPAAIPAQVMIYDPAASPTAVFDQADQTVRVGEAFEFSAEDCLGVGGTGLVPAVQWNWGDGDWTHGREMLSGAHCYTRPDEYTVTLIITNSAGAQAIATRTVTVEAFPAPTVVYNCDTVAEIHAAWALCTGGEHIVTPANIVIGGTIDLPAKTLTDYVTFRSDGTMPHIDTRIAYTSNQLTTIRATDANEPALIIRKTQKMLRFIGWKFDPLQTPGTRTGYIVYVGPYGFDDQRQISDNPEKIIFQHCAIRPDDDIEIMHAILADGYKVSHIGCQYVNIKSFGNGDGQAVSGFNARGCHVYLNSEIQAATQCIMYGGVEPTIDGILTKNVEIRRCLFSKDFRWMTWVDPFGRGSINMKTNWECKAGTRIFMEGSISDGHWDSGRSQFWAWNFKSSCAAGNADDLVPQAMTHDLKIHNTILRNAYGLLVTTTDSYDNIPFRGLKVQNVELENILVKLRSSYSVLASKTTRGLQVSDSDAVSVRHITLVVDTTGESAKGGWVSFNSNNLYDFVFDDSIITERGSPFNGSGASQGFQAFNYGTGGTTGDSWNEDPDATGRVNGNVVQTPDANVFPWTTRMPRDAPNDNEYVETIAEIGFTDHAGGDYSLAPSSPHKNAASDGRDRGVADMTELLARTATTESGTGWVYDTSGIPGDANGDGIVNHGYFFGAPPQTY
jgi:hypothetical protein